MKFLVLLGLVAVAQAADLAEQVQVSLRAETEADQQSAANCLQKCAAIFKVEQNSASAIACAQGCQYCKCSRGTTVNGIAVAGNPNANSNNCLSSSGYKSNNDECFSYCKSYDWSGIGLCKDVVEPDKACMYGCINALCQGNVCTGCNPQSGKGCCWDPSKPDGAGNGCQSYTTTYGDIVCSTCCPDCDTYQQCGCNNGADPALCGNLWETKGIPNSCPSQN